MKPKKKWLRFRHKVIRNLAFCALYPYSRLKYGITIDKFKEQGNRQYLILFNHQTAFDQFFVGMAFKGPIYYLASEDIFSNGFISKLLNYAVAPIPIKKQTNDVRAVMNCIRVAREGGIIALAPEGNRTYSGKTEYIKPSIISLIKKLSLPIVFYRIEGGYGVHPRWSDVVRKGKMHAGVFKVCEPEEYKKLSDDELYSLICSSLYVNEANCDSTFINKKSAEYVERALYVCPECGLAEFESENNTFFCKKCGLKVNYKDNTELEAVNGDIPFKYFNDWYEYQSEFIKKLDLSQYYYIPMFNDTARLSQVEVYKRKIPIDDSAQIGLFGDRIVITSDNVERVFKFDELSAVSVLGKNKLNIYTEDKLYQLKGSKRFNALKYVNIFYCYKARMRGEENVEFLGL